MSTTPAVSRLHLVHGEERLLVDQAAGEWCERAPFSQTDVEIFEAPAKLDALRRSVMEVPLFDPERVILVRDPPQLAGAGRRGGDPPEALAELLADVAPTTWLCLVSHVKVAAQNPVPAALRRAGGTIAYHPAPRARDLRAWLENEIRGRGLRLPPGAVETLQRTAGPDLGALAGELDKLAALSSTRELTREDVERLVSGDEPMEFWGVLEQLLGPSPGRGAATLAGLLGEGRSTQHLLAVVAGQARDLLLAHAIVKKGGGGAAVAAQMRIPEWRAERLVRQAREVQPSVVAAWITQLAELDRRAKAGEIADVEALRVFALRAADAVQSGRHRPAPA